MIRNDNVYIQTVCSNTAHTHTHTHINQSRRTNKSIDGFNFNVAHTHSTHMRAQIKSAKNYTHSPPIPIEIKVIIMIICNDQFLISLFYYTYSIRVYARAHTVHLSIDWERRTLKEQYSFHTIWKSLRYLMSLRSCVAAVGLCVILLNALSKWF